MDQEKELKKSKSMEEEWEIVGDEKGESVNKDNANLEESTILMENQPKSVINDQYSKILAQNMDNPQQSFPQNQALSSNPNLINQNELLTGLQQSYFFVEGDQDYNNDDLQQSNFIYQSTVQQQLPVKHDKNQKDNQSNDGKLMKIEEDVENTSHSNNSQFDSRLAETYIQNDNSNLFKQLNAEEKKEPLLIENQQKVHPIETQSNSQTQTFECTFIPIENPVQNNQHFTDLSIPNNQSTLEKRPQEDQIQDHQNFSQSPVLNLQQVLPPNESTNHSLTQETQESYSIPTTNIVNQNFSEFSVPQNQSIFNPQYKENQNQYLQNLVDSPLQGIQQAVPPIDASNHSNTQATQESSSIPTENLPQNYQNLTDCQSTFESKLKENQNQDQQNLILSPLQDLHQAVSPIDASNHSNTQATQESFSIQTENLQNNPHLLSISNNQSILEFKPQASIKQENDFTVNTNNVQVNEPNTNKDVEIENPIFNQTGALPSQYQEIVHNKSTEQVENIKLIQNENQSQQIEPHNIQDPNQLAHLQQQANKIIQVKVPSQYSPNLKLYSAIQNNYVNKGNNFFQDPIPIDDRRSAHYEEFKFNPQKLEKIQQLFSQNNIVASCKVRGDGNCFFRSFINGYILTKIGLFKNGTDEKLKIQGFFEELQQIPLLTPTCQKECLGYSFPQKDIEEFVKEHIRKLFEYVIQAQNSIQAVVQQLNYPEIDFSLQVLSKSLLLDAARKAIAQEVSPLCFILLIDELEESISKLNTENGDDSLFSLVASYLNCKLSIIRCQKTGAFDSVEFEPSPGFQDSFLKFQTNNEELMNIALWYKTGHYYLLITSKQLKLLF